jgi:hydrogenase maturation protein HypF
VKVYQLEVKGVVQGVGFRPFIYRIAQAMAMRGEVYNDSRGVYIRLAASKDRVEQFMHRVTSELPPLAHIDEMTLSSCESSAIYSEFTITQSRKNDAVSVRLPLDVSICEQCTHELFDPHDRRYRYPFITCTNCGPRYSIIKRFPYDRSNTSMDTFVMCEACTAEYTNPLDRRYHAEPIGCFACGPKLSMFQKETPLALEQHAMIDQAVALLKEGKIIALKGVGGYHLVCDAADDEAVKSMRIKKKRPAKPFALMVQNMEKVQLLAKVNDQERRALSSNKRPIVLLKKSATSHQVLSRYVAPEIDQVGVMLPYTPLHYLIVEAFGGAIVATSANISGDPICSTIEEVMQLSDVWDYCLDHDREIVNSCDDSILFVENDQTFIVRDSRGSAPKASLLEQEISKKTLALGANQKTTVMIAEDKLGILSPYIGDLGSIKSLEHYDATIKTLKRVYDFEPERLVCDRHPHYESTKYAQALIKKHTHLELMQLQHHYAHILSVMGERSIDERVLGVSFDGTGYGDDGMLWGGEFFICDRHSYERIAHFKYFQLLGGEQAIKEPRRIALSFLLELYGEDALEMDHAAVHAFAPWERKALYRLWLTKSSVQSSSCGRLFDLVASLTDTLQLTTYEGESGLRLETLYDASITESYAFSIEDQAINFFKVVEQMLEESDPVTIVSKFFNTLVAIIEALQRQYDLPLVAGGGVFQNRTLIRLLMHKMPHIIFPKDLPCNDSAIAYGQLIYSASSSAKK